MLAEIQEQDNPEFTESRLRSCLAGSLASVYRQLTVEFDVPQRISLGATAKLIADYFSANRAEGKDRRLLAAALMRTIGDRFGIFDRVIRLGINEADSAADSPGDILCYYQDALVLAVEVKDRITLDASRH